MVVNPMNMKQPMIFFYHCEGHLTDYMYGDTYTSNHYVLENKDKQLE